MSINNKSDESQNKKISNNLVIQNISKMKEPSQTESVINYDSPLPPICSINNTTPGINKINNENNNEFLIINKPIQNNINTFKSCNSNINTPYISCNNNQIINKIDEKDQSKIKINQEQIYQNHNILFNLNNRASLQNQNENPISINFNQSKSEVSQNSKHRCNCDCNCSKESCECCYCHTPKNPLCECDCLDFTEACCFQIMFHYLIYCLSYVLLILLKAGKWFCIHIFCRLLCFFISGR